MFADVHQGHLVGGCVGLGDQALEQNPKMPYESLHAGLVEQLPRVLDAATQFPRSFPEIEREIENRRFFLDDGRNDRRRCRCRLLELKHGRRRYRCRLLELKHDLVERVTA